MSTHAGKAAENGQTPSYTHRHQELNIHNKAAEQSAANTFGIAHVGDATVHSVVQAHTWGAAQRRKNEQAEKNSDTGINTNLPNGKHGNTGLPEPLKAGIENLSGISMDHINVHYGSSQPAQLQAHAFAQGNDIHLAPGQEKYLPHEAWHVVQQQQGRVQPTVQTKRGVNINDDAKLEHEADVMGAKADSAAIQAKSKGTTVPTSNPSNQPIQRHEDFHKNLDKDSRDKIHQYGARTTHHKISQAYLKNLAAALQTALMDKNTARAAADFQQALMEARHRHVASTDIFTMLNNMPINLEVGPDQAARKADPGHLFDGNTEPDTDSASEGTSGKKPKLKRRLTLRSRELRKINDVIEDKILPKGKSVTSDEWTMMAAAVRAATNEHQRLTKSKHNMLSDVKDEQWEKLPKGLWAKKKTGRMERDFEEADMSMLKEAANHRKQREKEERRKQRAESARKQGERKKIDSAKMALAQKLLGITKRNYKSKDIDAIFALLPAANEYPPGIKAITKNEISPSSSQYKAIRKKKNKYGNPSNDPVGDAKKFIDKFKILIGLIEEEDEEEEVATKSTTPEGVHEERWGAFMELIEDIEQNITEEMRQTAQEVADSQMVGAYAPKTKEKKEEKNSSKKQETTAPKKDEIKESKKEKEKEATAQGYSAEMFETIPNVGGGDCLFHALAGRNLSMEELLQVRQTVSEAVGDMGYSQERRNTNTIVALDQTGIDFELALGRNITNDAYAALQATQGVYAGDDELTQWCAINESTVVVVQNNGTVSTFTGDGRVANNITEDNTLEDVIGAADIALYKTPGHYVKITNVL